MIPMLVMTGHVDNVFRSDEGVNKKTGETYGGRWTIQLRVNLPLRDTDGVKRRMIDLSTEHYDYFLSKLNQQVSVPVGVMNGKTEPIFFILKGWRPPNSGVPVSPSVPVEPV